MLIGVLIGIAVGLFFMMHSNFHSAVLLVNQDNNYLFRLRKDVSFFNKPIVKKTLERIPNNAYVIIDISRADFIDKDIVEEINNFLCHAHLKRIKIDIKKSNQKETLDLINHLEALKNSSLAL
jgi:MFS superfamily sulfate permease-like transporter